MEQQEGDAAPPSETKLKKSKSNAVKPKKGDKAAKSAAESKVKAPASRKGKKPQAKTKIAGKATKPKAASSTTKPQPKEKAVKKIKTDKKEKGVKAMKKPNRAKVKDLKAMQKRRSFPPLSSVSRNILSHLHQGVYSLLFFMRLYDGQSEHVKIDDGRSRLGGGRSATPSTSKLRIRTQEMADAAEVCMEGLLTTYLRGPRTLLPAVEGTRDNPCFPPLGVKRKQQVKVKHHRNHNAEPPGDLKKLDEKQRKKGLGILDESKDSKGGKRSDGKKKPILIPRKRKRTSRMKLTATGGKSAGHVPIWHVVKQFGNKLIVPLLDFYQKGAAIDREAKIETAKERWQSDKKGQRDPRPKNLPPLFPTSLCLLQLSMATLLRYMLRVHRAMVRKARLLRQQRKVLKFKTKKEQRDEPQKKSTTAAKKKQAVHLNSNKKKKSSDLSHALPDVPFNLDLPKGRNFVRIPTREMARLVSVVEQLDRLHLIYSRHLGVQFEAWQQFWKVISNIKDILLFSFRAFKRRKKCPIHRRVPKLAIRAIRSAAVCTPLFFRKNVKLVRDLFPRQHVAMRDLDECLNLQHPQLWLPKNLMKYAIGVQVDEEAWVKQRREEAAELAAFHSAIGQKHSSSRRRARGSLGGQPPPGHQEVMIDDGERPIQFVIPFRRCKGIRGILKRKLEWLHRYAANERRKLVALLEGRKKKKPTQLSFSVTQSKGVAEGAPPCVSASSTTAGGGASDSDTVSIASTGADTKTEATSRGKRGRGSVVFSETQISSPIASTSTSQMDPSTPFTPLEEDDSTLPQAKAQNRRCLKPFHVIFQNALIPKLGTPKFHGSPECPWCRPCHVLEFLLEGKKKDCKWKHIDAEKVKGLSEGSIKSMFSIGAGVQEVEVGGSSPLSSSTETPLREQTKQEQEEEVKQVAEVEEEGYAVPAATVRLSQRPPKTKKNPMRYPKTLALVLSQLAKFKRGEEIEAVDLPSDEFPK